ncbi:lysophospholipid acyltransferase family protein [Vitiosangium sp. GDMCC 1.1324]|uniref:lysophospholipid acyltransferase family protein n=1 Tax=Vitiosangium sp. (strain GDMCC 1.1324) TaxID=2138576 RepID=UPI000D356B91|nr:lysophospholipid acyltransferase family protein [Vitiosangium sp. GDMCC 1.1324]PTL81715.1 acyltransferase [Vitiosangium sp. GDMCC 1.1324]
MIRAAKGGLLGWLADGYVGWKFRSSFRGLWVRGTLPAGTDARLVYANHTNWWDGFVLHQLCQAAGWDIYCVMEEQNLERYRFLARLGAFSIRRGEGSSSLETLRYAGQLLKKPRAAVCIFPEGELRPFGVLPMRLERGVELLARVGKAECVPIAIRYAFFEHERPDVLVEIGTPHRAGPLPRFQSELESAVRRLAETTSLEDFTRVVSGGRGVAERWDAVRGKAPSA